MKNFLIDFASPTLLYRVQHAAIRKELLARALGLKKNHPITIIDATGGIGRDSFMIAALGFSITLVERSAPLYTLLQDAMTRGLTHPQLMPILKRMQLIHADAIAYLKTIPAPDVIYVDPMFPERRKSALVKKEMRFLQEIVGDDNDADELLKTALSCAKQRVVVKRPRLAAPLANITPTYQLLGKSSRFDIYIIGHS